MEDEKLISFRGELKLLSEGDGLLQKVEVWLLNGEVNRNNWKYLRLEEHRPKFANTPILVAYKGKQIGDGHNFEEVRDPDGKVRASFMSATAERIVGWFRSDKDIRIETRDNIDWIVGIGYIWKWYASELVAKLRSQGSEGGDMPVSIETLINSMHKDGNTEVYDSYEILGTTILGDNVEPAVADASIRALSAIGGAGIRELTLRVAAAQSAAGPENGEAAKPKQQKRRYSMKVSKELSAAFPDYRVLAANGNKALLCNSDGMYTAEFTANGADISAGAVVNAMDPSVTFGDGDESIAIALSDIRSNDAAEIARLTESLKTVTAERDNAQEAVKNMAAAEKERRKNAAKACIERRYAEICENAGIECDRKACDALLTDECLNAYAEAEDKEGHWIGEENAKRDVESICMRSIDAASKKARANARQKFSFDFADDPQGSGDPVDDLIEKTMKKEK